MTKAQLLTEIDNNALVSGQHYFITNATSALLPVLVLASSTNTIQKKVELLGDNFDLVEYDLQNDRLYCYDYLAGVVRNTHGIWELVGGAHDKKKIASVHNYGNSAMRIVYDRNDYTAVVSVIGTADETYAKNGVSLGFSAGVHDATCFLYKTSEPFVGGAIAWNGTQFIKLGGAFSMQWVNNRLLITHEEIGGGTYNVSLQRRNVAGYTVSAGSLTSTTTEVIFLDSSGNQVTTPDSLMSLYFERRGGANQVVFNSMTYPNSNIWITGTMLKRI